MTGKYGPYTDKVLAVIERLKTLSYDDAEAVQVAWELFPREFRYSAMCAAEYAIMQSDLKDYWQAARRDVLDFFRGEARYTPWYGRWDAVVSAALDYILTLYAGKSLDGHQYAILYTPWSSAIRRGVRQ